MSPEAIAERAKAVRLSVKLLSDLAGCSENTVQRTLTARTQPFLKTADKLSDALIAEEKRLLDYLIALHGIPEQLRAAS